MSSIGSIGSGLVFQSTATSGSAQATQRRDSSIPPPPGSAQGGAGGISRPGALLSQLQQLEQSDPAQFKQVISEMAKALRADAQKEGGEAAQRLDAFAGRLDQVASSGDLSQLAPPEGQRHATPQGVAAYQQQGGAHHGHHHGGGQFASDLQSAFEQAMAAIQGGGAAGTTAAG